jgi:hypothetical protein
VSPVKVESRPEVDTTRGNASNVAGNARQVQRKKNETLPPDATIDYAMDQMGAPRHPDESSEMYARCQAAVQYIRETPSWGDAATEASESISQIMSIYPPPQQIPLLDEWKDHVSYQRLREDDLCQSGESQIDDQGVRFVGHQPVGHEQHHFTVMANDEPDPRGSDDKDDDGNDDRGQRDPRRPVPRHEGNRNNPSSPPRRHGGGGGGGGGGGDGGGNGGGDNGSDGEPNGNRRPSQPPNRNS